MRKEQLKISPRRFKSKWARLWIIRDIKVDGRIEIEAPYSRRTKLVTSDKLKLYRCEVGKDVKQQSLSALSVRLVTLNKRFMGGNPVL